MKNKKDKRRRKKIRCNLIGDEVVTGTLFALELPT